MSDQPSTPEDPEPDAPDPTLTPEEIEVTYPPEGDVPEVDDDPEVETAEVPE